MALLQVSHTMPFDANASRMVLSCTCLSSMAMTVNESCRFVLYWIGPTFCFSAAAIGRLMVKILPSPWLLDTSIFPFISETRFLTMESPKPNPGWVTAFPNLANSLKICFCCLSSNPVPESLTFSMNTPFL